MNFKEIVPKIAQGAKNLNHDNKEIQCEKGAFRTTQVGVQHDLFNDAVSNTGIQYGLIKEQRLR